MHIDHSKLVELLAEASGVEKDKAEQQLSGLVAEIKETIKEGDAYEVDGLGVFSGIGSNIIFIPSDEFATEINYKYVGMEPIEMDEAPDDTLDDSADEAAAEGETALDEEEDPFAGLLDDEAESTDDLSAQDKPAETKPSFKLDVPEEEEDEALDEEKASDVEEFADETAEEAPFDIADENLEEETAEEVPSDPEIEEKPGPDKWGIDTYKDDSDESMFSGLLGDQKEEAQEEGEGDDSESDDAFSSLLEVTEDEGEDDTDLAAELSKQFSDETEEDSLLEGFLSDENEEEEESEQEGIDLAQEAEFNDEEEKEEELVESAPAEIEEDEDFDDPFAAIAEEEDLDEELSQENDEEEVVPVITNLASESAKKKKEEREKEEEKPADAQKKSPSARKSKKQPVMLWVLLIIVVLGGGIYGLGYFGMIDIPGVTPQPQVASTPQPTPPVKQPANEEPPSQETPQQEQSTAGETAENEQEEQPEQTPVSQERTVPENQPTYGLKGVPVPVANSGYTIVIYSLRNENNARAKQNELSQEGFRTITVPIPSQQYGTLWRVSLGQFESLRDAAIAAETLEPPFSENYFITEIQ